jgi:hypothetical protein
MGELAMITNQNLIRKMGAFDVTQRTADGMFDTNALLTQWNNQPGMPRRKMVKYLGMSGTTELVNAIETELNPSRKSDHGDNVIVKTIKGKNTINGRTPDSVWMHPYLFIDFAMWLNPTFKVKVLKFVYDELIKYRNEAGDSYREMSAAIKTIVKPDYLGLSIRKVAQAMNIIVYGEHTQMIRNTQADEKKVRELAELERTITMLITDRFIKDYDSLLNYLRKVWQKKYHPKALFANS